jgi:hypothetical protein
MVGIKHIERVDRCAQWRGCGDFRVGRVRRRSFKKRSWDLAVGTSTKRFQIVQPAFGAVRLNHFILVPAWSSSCFRGVSGGFWIPWTRQDENWRESGINNTAGTSFICNRLAVLDSIVTTFLTTIMTPIRPHARPSVGGHREPECSDRRQNAYSPIRRARLLVQYHIYVCGFEAQHEVADDQIGFAVVIHVGGDHRNRSRA